MATSLAEFGPIGQGGDDSAAFEAAQTAALARGHRVIAVPPGHYIADVVMWSQLSLQSQRRAVTIEAAAPGGYALHYPPASSRDHMWQRPFVEGIACVGAGRTKGGIRIENKIGVDLIDCAFHQCTTGLWNADNYYGSWDRLMIVDNEVGIHFSDNGTGYHTGNKRIWNATVRENGIGVLVENLIRATVFLGGTFEANRTSIVVDYALPDAWNDTGALHVRDAWFEGSQLSAARGAPRALRDGTEIPVTEVYVHDGTLVLDNCGVSFARIGAQGRLFADFSFIGRGPANAFLDIQEGGYFEHAHSLVPAPAVTLSPGLGTG